MPKEDGRAALEVHQAACRQCHVCADQGIIPEASPTFQGVWGAPFFLVGQAPGPAERETRQPFSGRAGKELDRWMIRAGFKDRDEFRRLTYIAALMRCFPGRNPQNTGDLRPPPAAVANCAHWLDAELKLLRPRMIIFGLRSFSSASSQCAQLATAAGGGRKSPVFVRLRPGKHRINAAM